MKIKTKYFDYIKIDNAFGLDEIREFQQKRKFGCVVLQMRTSALAFFRRGKIPLFKFSIAFLSGLSIDRIGTTLATN